MRLLTTTAEREAFAAERDVTLRAGERFLEGSVRRALRAHERGEPDWYAALLRRAVFVLRRAFRAETGKFTSPELRDVIDRFTDNLTESLKLTNQPNPLTYDTQVQAIALSLSTAAHNAAMEAAGRTLSEGTELVKTWLSMDDDRVRPAHRDADGQKRPFGQNFTVGGVDMAYPGDVRAPVELWINCRCVIGITYATIERAISAGGDMTTTETEAPPVIEAPDTPLEWYGVLAPEDVISGDGRKFAANSLRTRDLPLPLSWQKVNDDGHKGSVTVGRIDNVWRQDGQIRGRGVFLSSVPEADEAVGLLAEGGIRGVSIDADDGTMQMELRDGTPLDEAMSNLRPETDDYEGDGIDLDQIITVFTDARICGATLCPIPAFQEAFVAIGEMPDGFGPEDEPQQPETDVAEPTDVAAALDFEGDFEEFRSISEKPWDGSSSRFTDEQWCRSTVLSLESGCTSKSQHKLPILEPSGALSRAGVHNAAARFNQTQGPPEAKARAKAALRAAYGALKEDVPDVLKASDDTDEFGRGPGWITHPVPTKRIHDYWTVPGHAGYAKIRWGVPGDFNRCRVEVGEEIGENSPDKLRFLNQICAQWHHDALGIWPGRPVAGETVPFTASGEAVHLVEFTPDTLPPHDWFTDPHLTGPSPIVVTADRHMFGHLATWGTCHIGFDKVCTVAPHSLTDYAYFRTGAVLTDDGEVAVGNITMDTGHAPPNCRAKAAVGHYDNTGFCVASVAAGEDEFGIWVSGWVPPDVPEAKVRTLRSVVLSGDWREVGTGLELVAALAVPVGGFPIPRTTLAASGGRQTSLVAAGMLTPTPDSLSGSDVRRIVGEVLAEHEAAYRRRKYMDDLRKKTKRDPKSRMAALAERRG